MFQGEILTPNGTQWECWLQKSSKKIAKAAFQFQKRAYFRHLENVISTLFLGI